MSPQHFDLSTVNLDNCDQEPIHIPGFVQPHGVLLALDLEGRLTHASKDARGLLPSLCALGEQPTTAQLGGNAELGAALERVLDEAAEGHEVAPLAVEVPIGGAVHDVVLHAFDGRAIIEYERRQPGQEDLTSFALLAHRSMGRLRNRRDIVAMLEEAVVTVREITGFDRVMAYRFAHDDSGEVIAEARADDLDPYLGRRFPASDIPAQARRLYIINTLRLIANVSDEQVPIEAVPDDRRPLDLSHSVLRSVSPIHIEYLKNINVAASMSVSIVVAGRLWGLIACHHRTGHLVPYAIRMACDVLSQVVSASVHTALERAGAARRSAAADVRSKLVEIVLHGDDLLGGVGQLGDAMRQVIPSDAIVCSHSGKQRIEGGLAQEAALPLLRWLDEAPGDLVHIDSCHQMPTVVAEAVKPYCGVLAMRFDRVNRGWLVLLRAEQLETITWSGPPDKVARVGPHGSRLTPGGSFAEWRQVVEGTAVPWDENDQLIAQQVLDELGRATASRSAEMERARAQLLAVLGHDLRDPLQTISMAARILEHGDANSRMGQRITASTGRMERLITQVLDMSRLHGGLGLGMRVASHDVAALVRGLIDEASIAHPNIAIDASVPEHLQADIDPDRFAQVVGNLISNARHHGTPGEPIRVALDADDKVVRLVVSNVASAIPDDVAKVLFEPLKQRSMGNSRNPNGLGLGLYIASEIIRGHRGTIGYSHDGRSVSFTVELPR